MRPVTIDFLYLDLDTCERCVATGETVDEAVAVLAPVLGRLGRTVSINKVNITTRALAQEWRFVSSPTVRVDGVDICTELKESDCADCGALCGTSTACRVFVFDGQDYEQPPAAMIIDGILRVLYGPGDVVTPHDGYVVPANLEAYFAGRVAGPQPVRATTSVGGGPGAACCCGPESCGC